MGMVCEDTAGMLRIRAMRSLRRMRKEQADRSSCSQSPHDKKEWNDTRADPLLPERAR